MPDDHLTADAYFAVVPEWVIDSVSARGLQLYAVLRRFADYSKLQAWPSRDLLAIKCGCSVKTIDRTLAELVEAGAVSVESRFHENQQRSNLYQIHAIKRGDTSVAPRGDMSVAQGGDTSVAQNDSHLELEPIEQEGGAPLRKRDYLWESFVAVHGEPATKAERGKYNRTVALLKEAKVTPDEYPLLVIAYTTKHGDGLQPGVATIAQRVGELRHFVAQGPVRGGSKVDEARWRARQAIGGTDDT